MQQLLQAIGFSHRARIIQVVGTNGKGSSVAFLESVLKAHGLGVGLFSSPHLCSARERIRINGALISYDEFCEAAEVVLSKGAALNDEPSFFEYMLAMALWQFEKAGVEIIILEAGLGGRLDATTATAPDILGVSMIDLDHQHILGATIEHIASEKIAAARPGQRVVFVKQNVGAAKVIEQAAVDVGFALIASQPCDAPLGLYGAHQRYNAGLALELIKQLGIALDPKKTARGLLEVNWPGRFEIITEDHQVIVLDGAHNPSGITSLVNALKSHPQCGQKPLIVLYGSLAGDNAREKVRLLHDNDLDVRGIFLHAPNNPRALPITVLRNLLIEVGYGGQLIQDFHEWSAVIKQAGQERAAIVVCGSLYTVGELRALLLSIEMDEKPPNF